MFDFCALRLNFYVCKTTVAKSHITIVIVMTVIKGELRHYDCVIGKCTWRVHGIRVALYMMGRELGWEDCGLIELYWCAVDVIVVASAIDEVIEIGVGVFSFVIFVAMFIEMCCTFTVANR